jgi:hypothetical protein
MMTDMSLMRATMKQNRAERKAMADSRAMEEQMERENPLSGRGATPSMGLSQVRGGKKMMKNAAAQGKQLMEHLASLHGSGYAKQFHEGMKGAGFFSNLGHGLSDVAGMFGLGKQESDSESDEEDMKKKKGAGPFSNLGHGISDVVGMFGLGKKGGLHTGRYEGEGTGGAKISAAEKKALKSVLEKHEMDGGSRCVGAGTGGRMGPVPYGRPQKPKMELMDGGFSFSEMMMRRGGPGGINYDHSPNIKHGLPDPLEYQKMREKMTGKKEPMVAYGKPKKEKRVVGAGDGRRKRAEIVRKVMAEKGMKMIEASKYVKEHGLYNP